VAAAGGWVGGSVGYFQERHAFGLVSIASNIIWRLLLRLANGLPA
jgi:hypothetical protein